MHPRLRREGNVRSGPVERNRTVRCVGISLAHLVVCLGIQCWIGPRNRIGARVCANDFPLGIDNLEPRRARIPGKVVVDDRTRRRILARRDLRWPRRGIVHRAPHANCRRGLHQKCRGSRVARSRNRAQRRHVIENPETTTVRARDEIRAEAAGIVLQLNVAHGDCRHVDAERLPVISVIERNPHLRIATAI